MKIKYGISALVTLLLLSSCGGTGKEKEIRHRLGVPDSAKTVVILQQTAHLDPDWLMTFEDYYEKVVENIYISALELVNTRSNYVYTAGILAFLKKFYEDHPEYRDVLKSAVARGKFRIIGGGFTSPDTLLPSGESLLMDYEMGMQWLAEHIEKVNISAAWLPDSFGHTPTLPDILSYMGYRSVAFARIDGTTSELDEAIQQVMGLESLDPVPYSTAWILKNSGSADFLWRGPMGGEVVAHWMPYNLYCLGGSIDSGVPISVVNNVFTPGSTNKKLVLEEMQHLINLMQPLSPTPYIFIPIGCDFEMPKKGLDLYVKWWNEYRYPSTGTYVVLASFQDYGELVWEHRDEIPVMTADLNPYFMGFYASRPEIKDMARENLYLLLTMEALRTEAIFFGAASREDRAEEIKDLWWKNSFTNHHDFITGTSPDPVFETEQLPWLENLNSLASQTARHFLSRLATSGWIELSPVGNEAVVFNPAGVTSSIHAQLITYSQGQELSQFTAATFYVNGASVTVPADYRYSVKTTSGTFANIYEADVLDVPAYGYKKVKLLATTVPSPITITYYRNGSPSTSASYNEIRVSTPYLKAEFTSEPFWALRSLEDSEGHEYLGDSSFYPASYKDDGGPWEFGHEMEGCTFQLSKKPSEAQQNITVKAGKSRITVKIEYQDLGVTVEYHFYAYQKYLDLEVSGRAYEGTTVTLQLSVQSPVDEAWFSAPFGQVKRVSQKIFNPTFWPSSEWVAFGNADGNVLILNRGIQAWHYEEDGSIEAVILRNVSLEKCRLLTVPTFYASSSGTYTRTLRIVPRQTFDHVAAWKAAIAFNGEPAYEKLLGMYSAPEKENGFVSVYGDGIATSLMPTNNAFRLRILFPGFAEGLQSAKVQLPRGASFARAINMAGEKAAEVKCHHNLCTVEALRPIVDFYFK